MLRYTALLHTSEHPVDLAALKVGVENILLRAYSPITYRLGKMVEVRHGLVLIEIATDARKEYLAKLLQGLEDKYPLEVKEVGWGWTVTKPQIPAGPDQIHTGVDVDPFVATAIQSEPIRAYHPSKRQLVWFFARLILSLYLLLCVVVVAVSYFMPNPFGDWVSDHFGLLWVPIWLVLVMSSGQSHSFAFWKFPSSVQCDDDGIEITYGLVPRSRRLPWNDIQTLEIGSTECVLRSTTQALKFHLSTLYGRQDFPGLVSIIAKHASLHFVGAMRSAYVYKRFAAP